MAAAAAAAAYTADLTLMACSASRLSIVTKSKRRFVTIKVPEYWLEPCAPRSMVVGESAMGRSSGSKRWATCAGSDLRWLDLGR